jgi:hypothetical protein
MAESKKKPSTETLRAALKDRIGVDIAVAMADSMLAALESTKTEWFECQHCHKKNPFVLPNAFERAKACQMVLEQLEGKVGTQKEAPAGPKVKAGDLQDLSDDDLLALLSAPPDDGEQ